MDEIRCADGGKRQGRSYRLTPNALRLCCPVRYRIGEKTSPEWKEQWFLPKYPGFDGDGLDAFESIVEGNTLLTAVRDSCADD